MQQVNTATFSAEANRCYQYAGFVNVSKRYGRFSIAVLVTRHTIKRKSHFTFAYSMIGKRAKILSQAQVEDLLFFAQHTRHPIRNQVIVLLSVKAGLRAAEIANLTWEMVVDPTGEIATTLELQDRVAKKGRGRVIPIHPDLREALIQLRESNYPASGPIIVSERGGSMRPITIVVWFARAYRAIGLTGCSSHSGRRTFITKAARLVHRAGGSLRDVQVLAGHRSLLTTQRYIDGDTDVQRQLVALI
jgi:integrase/recombinase XerD